MIETRYAHIVLDKNEVPIISGTTMKVIELVCAHFGYGWSPEELYFQFPYLTLGKIHSALAYYWDHRKEMDDVIDRQLKEIDEYRKATDNSHLIARLKAKRLIE
jgi:uncharacterized protein (DUF433 family)